MAEGLIRPDIINNLAKPEAKIEVPRPASKDLVKLEKFLVENLF